MDDKLVKAALIIVVLGLFFVVAHKDGKIQDYKKRLLESAHQCDEIVNDRSINTTFCIKRK